MFSKLFKPKWQHKDAKVRIQALNTLTDNGSEMIHLAQFDPDTGVRLEALARLTDLPTLLALGQRSDTFGERARARTLVVVTTDNSHDAALLEHFTWLEQNPALLKSIARDPERYIELRKRALPYVDDADLLFRIANEDVSRDIQFAAASRIHDLDKLKKLEKTHGKNNKRLRQLLKERVALEEAQQQQLQAMEQCCEQLEGLGLSGRWEQDKTQLLVLQQRWQQFADADIPIHLKKRFNDADKAFQCRLEAYQAQEAKLNPIREVFQGLLMQLKTLHQRMGGEPETLTLADIDQVLNENRQQWQNQTMLPPEYQVGLNEDWESELYQIQHLRAALVDEYHALDEMRAVLTKSEQFKNSKQALKSPQILALQSEWTGLVRPKTLKESVPELEGQFQQLISSLNARLSKEAKLREENVQALTAQLMELEQQLDLEQYSHAIELHHRLQQCLKETPDLPVKDANHIKQRLSILAPMIRELQDWRRWGTDQAREHLIESAEHLQEETSIDPQERAKRIRNMRDEWRKLARLDPGHQHQQWKEFDKKVSAAYEPSKQHFAEQAQQRQENLQKRYEICDKLAQLATETQWDAVDLDWRLEYQKINQLRKQWKQAGTVSHKDWKEVNERFNQAMDALEVHLQVERQRNWQARALLVQKVTELADADDLVMATEKAKQLQNQWQITIPSRQGDEQRLWKQFRQPMDELFERLKQERDSARNEQQESIQQKEKLCEQLEHIAALSEDEFLQSSQRQAELGEDFYAIRDLPRAIHKKLEARWSAAQQSIQTKQQQLYWQRQLKQLDHLATQQTIVLEAVGADLEGERLCLELELLLDLETPPDFQQRRIAYQVERMSESMTSRRQDNNKPKQAISLLKRWYELGLSQGAYEQQQPRILAARQQVINSVGD